jgi:hypothetical protein
LVNYELADEKTPAAILVANQMSKNSYQRHMEMIEQQQQQQQ